MRLFQNPDDLRLHSAEFLRIQPCPICGCSMSRATASPTNEDGEPICVTCGVNKIVCESRAVA
jgi:hypothetical protein